MRSYHNDSLTITISLKLKLPVLKVNKFKKKNLLVMPSSTMSCILQHDEIILELRRSTTRTYYFEKFKLSIFPVFNGASVSHQVNVYTTLTSESYFTVYLPSIRWPFWLRESHLALDLHEVKQKTDFMNGLRNKNNEVKYSTHAVQPQPSKTCFLLLRSLFIHKKDGDFPQQPGQMGGAHSYFARGACLGRVRARYDKRASASFSKVLVVSDFQLRSCFLILRPWTSSEKTCRV